MAAQRRPLAPGLRRRPARARTVAEAIADPTCPRGSSSGGTRPSRTSTLPTSEIADYRAALLDRFANPRIGHRLAQIATDGSQKIPVRILPVLRAERAAGRMPLGAARADRGLGRPPARAGDSRSPTREAERWIALADGADGVRRVLAALGDDLGDDDELARRSTRLTVELLR